MGAMSNTDMALSLKVYEVKANHPGLTVLVRGNGNAVPFFNLRSLTSWLVPA